MIFQCNLMRPDGSFEPCGTVHADSADTAARRRAVQYGLGTPLTPVRVAVRTADPDDPFECGWFTLSGGRATRLSNEDVGEILGFTPDG